MRDQTPRIQAWLLDLKAIIVELHAGVRPTSKPSRKHPRKRKPLWEE